jgi:hypothetical protein
VRTATVAGVWQAGSYVRTLCIHSDLETFKIEDALTDEEKGPDYKRRADQDQPDRARQAAARRRRRCRAGPAAAEPEMGSLPNL